MLLKNVIREVKGGAIDKGKSYRVIVGTICTLSSIPKSSGGELFNSVQILKFRGGT